MKMYQILLVLGLLFAACSQKTDVDLFNEGKEAQEKGNFQLAVERYEEIVTRFEKTAYAESALYRAGLVYNNDLHDIPKAVAAYRKFFDLYSQNKQAPTALFLAGFLLNNEMHMIDSARRVYQIFLEKYPSHELATSARFELETLGKDPSSLLRIDTVAAGDAGSPPPARKSGPERRTKRKASH